MKLGAFWTEHIKEVTNCAKCTATRGSADIRALYTEEGSSGKASKPQDKRACCFFSHSLDPARIVAKTKEDPGFAGFTDRQLLPLAKRFMEETKGAAPLGKPHPSERKLDFSVRVNSSLARRTTADRAVDLVFRCRSTVAIRPRRSTKMASAAYASCTAPSTWATTGKV